MEPATASADQLAGHGGGGLLALHEQMVAAETSGGGSERACAAEMVERGGLLLLNSYAAGTSAERHLSAAAADELLRAFEVLAWLADEAPNMFCPSTRSPAFAASLACLQRLDPKATPAEAAWLAAALDCLQRVLHGDLEEYADADECMRKLARCLAADMPACVAEAAAHCLGACFELAAYDVLADHLVDGYQLAGKLLAACRRPEPAVIAAALGAFRDRTWTILVEPPCRLGGALVDTLAAALAHADLGVRTAACDMCGMLAGGRRYCGSGDDPVWAPLGQAPLLDLLVGAAQLAAPAAAGSEACAGQGDVAHAALAALATISASQPAAVAGHAGCLPGLAAAWQEVDTDGQRRRLAVELLLGVARSSQGAAAVLQQPALMEGLLAALGARVLPEEAARVVGQLGLHAPPSSAADVGRHQPAIAAALVAALSDEQREVVKAAQAALGAWAGRQGAGSSVDTNWVVWDAVVDLARASREAHSAAEARSALQEAIVGLAGVKRKAAPGGGAGEAGATQRQRTS